MRLAHHGVQGDLESLEILNCVCQMGKAEAGSSPASA
jgi:hypothetical protein